MNPDQLSPATVPEQPQAQTPLKKGLPLVLGLTGVVLLFGFLNVTSFIGSHKNAPRQSAMPNQPTSANPQQVSSFAAMQGLQAKKDAQDRFFKEQARAAQQGTVLADPSMPGPEADAAPPMTPAQRAQIYGDNPNAPKQTSGASEAQAEAKQRMLAREKQRQDALASDTVAIDFDRSGTPPAPKPVADTAPETADSTPAGVQSVGQQGGSARAKTDPMADYDFDAYQGRLYRVFEGTVLEGVVTNHIDGGFSGPILVMLTTDYYSHDHQQLLMPQGTRLIGDVQSVGNAQQRKMFVTFHRAVCPDGFSLDLDKYIGLDTIGTTGLATKVDHGYLQAFGAAAAIGGLGGLAQIGNSASILSPSAQLRSGITSQSSEEGEQVLNHFLNRLPIITLKEGSRARVYIGRDILIPSYAEHRVDPTL